MLLSTAAAHDSLHLPSPERGRERTARVWQVRRSFRLEFEEATALAEREAPGCEGVNFIPYLTGERTPNWPHASGSITGLRPGSLRPGLLYRAALEAATFSLLSGTRTVRGLCEAG